MSKDYIVQCVNCQKIDFKEELINFFQLYIKCYEKVSNVYFDCDDEGVLCQISGLSKWLINVGYGLIHKTITQLGNFQKDDVLGFVHLYEFLLSCAEDDVLKMIDLLFCIPTQFEKEFFIQPEQIVNDVYVLPTFVNFMPYSFNTKGAFIEVPYFFKESFV